MECTLGISCKQLYNKGDIIGYFYNECDEYFFTHIHKCSGTREQCIADTCASIEDSSELYGVYEDYKLVAFFSKYEDERGQSLNGFHVLKEYRNREFLEEFWQIVKSKFDQTIYTGIYVRNEPAIKTLLKAGFELHASIIHENKVFLIFKF
jgi:hypothetical protein